jgi:hypothetical protein
VINISRMRRGLPIEESSQDGITFDKLGRMEYHPEFHPNHGKPFTLDEIIYICKFHGIDEVRTISYAVGKTEHAIATLISRLRREGLYDLYKAMSYEHWARIVERNELIDDKPNRAG